MHDSTDHGPTATASRARTLKQYELPLAPEKPPLCAAWFDFHSV